MLSILRRLPLIGWFFHSHLINFGLAYGYIKVFRMVHIGGRYGGYKTALSMRIAFKLWQDGVIEHIYSNIGCAFNDDVEKFGDAPDPLDLRACVVFDEAGQFFNTRRDVTNVVAFLRKMKLVLIMPSVEPPTSRVTRLSIEPHYIFTSIGLPLVIYRCVLKGSRRSDDKTTYFGWWRPSEIFGIYDTKDAPVSGGGLDHALIELKNRIAKKVEVGSRYGRQEAAKEARKSGMLPVELTQVLDSPESQLESLTERFEEIADEFTVRLERSTEGVDDGIKHKKGWFN